MGEAAILASAFSAGSSILGGMAGKAEANGEKQRAQNNAYIGQTRAIQTSASGAESLASELATLRATFAANGQRPSVGNAAVFDELTRVRGRETRIAVANDKSGAADWTRQARNAQIAGNGAMLRGIAGAGPSLFDLFREKP